MRRPRSPRRTTPPKASPLLIASGVAAGYAALGVVDLLVALYALVAGTAGTALALRFVLGAALQLLAFSALARYGVRRWVRAQPPDPLAGRSG